MDTVKPKQNIKTNNTRKSFIKREGQDGSRRARPSFERPKPDFDQKMVSIRRVTRVVAGGRRMSFAVALAIGDKKGSVGLGTGKGGDTAIAIAKALRQAKKNMFKIKTTKNMSLPYEVSGKYSGSKLTLRPNFDKGLVAGSTIRDILLLAGIKNVTGKLHSGSKNKLNNARVAYKVLYQLKDKNPIVKLASFVASEDTGKDADTKFK
jgi:small subunit ribosomal protein S5